MNARRTEYVSWEFIEKFHCTFFSLDYWVNNNNNNNNNKPVEFNRTVFASETLGYFFSYSMKTVLLPLQSESEFIRVISNQFATLTDFQVAANFCFLCVRRKISKCARVFFVQYTSGVSTNDSVFTRCLLTVRFVNSVCCRCSFFAAPPLIH